MSNGNGGNGMTREEAYSLARSACAATWDEKTYNQIREALEQEPVLDKIRAEIDQKCHEYMLTGNYHEGVRLGLMLAYQIIDKYKAENKEK